MNHQPHTAAEAVDLIIDWFTDDDLLVYQMRKKINKKMNIFHQLLMLLDKDKIGVCLAAAPTAMKIAKPAIRILTFSTLLLDHMLMVLQHS